ncbi:MAG: hypothetical protein AB1454_14830 [Candidatus Auribacterota bacterium]
MAQKLLICLSVLVTLLFINTYKETSADINTKVLIPVQAYLGPENSPPVIANLLAEGSSGELVITYDLSDPESDICSIEVEYSSPSSPVWQLAAVSGTVSGISPATGLTVSWVSVTDLPDSNGEFAAIRIRAFDGLAWGDWEELSNIYVINTYVIQQLAYLDVFDPDINNTGMVVWRGDLFDNSIHIASDTYLFNTITTVQLTDFTLFTTSPRINDNGMIIWAASDNLDGSAHTGSDTEIYVYDGSAITRLTDNSYDDNTPAMNNSGTIVWSGWDGTDYEIFRSINNTTTQITSNSANDISPQVNDAGQIVWIGWDGTDYEVFLYSGGVTAALTTNNEADNDARINQSGDVVWAGWDGSDWEIYLYRSASVVQLTNNGIDDITPQLSDDGTVVWAAGSTAKDIYFHHGSTITQLTNTPEDDSMPQINASGDIVWSASNGISSNIRIYDGSAITSLTQDEYLNITPQLNDKLYIVWNRWNNTYWEIMLAYPRVAPSIEIVSLSYQSPFMELTWSMNPPYVPFTIYWGTGLSAWDAVNGSALNNITVHPDGTATWLDTGTDPEMGGSIPQNTEKRFYKIKTNSY